MSIVYSRKTRRQFLVGSGQTLLALPFLPSLLPSYAEAQASIAPRRLMTFVIDHHNEAQFWPNKGIATTAVGSIGVRERVLSSLGNSSASVISSLMSNPLYNTLLNNNQITIARGFENHLSQGNGHVTRALGGHSTAESGTSSENPNHRSTIDYIIENSPTVYANSPSNMTKSIRIDLHGTWNFVHRIGSRSINPGAYGYGGGLTTMYNSVFGQLTGQTITSPTDFTNTRKTNILNRVFPAFQNFKNNRKISSEDKIRLDQHLGFLSDLQKSISPEIIASTPTIVCAKPNIGLTGLSQLQTNQVYMDLLAVAFKCGLTKFGSFKFQAEGPTWIPGYTGGPGHHAVIHGESGLAAQVNAYTTFQSFIYNTIADRFLSPLNVEEGNTGRTYLDNMATACLTQLGVQPTGTSGNHWDSDIQHVVFGSMGGRLKSGRYYSVPNLPHNTMMMTLLNLIGVPVSEYVSNSSVAGQGFGYYKYANAALGNRFYTPVTEMLV